MNYVFEEITNLVRYDALVNLACMYTKTGMKQIEIVSETYSTSSSTVIRIKKLKKTELLVF